MCVSVVCLCMHVFVCMGFYIGYMCVGVCVCVCMGFLYVCACANKNKREEIDIHVFIVYTS